MNIFTAAREAVWAAIDNYGPLQGKFKSKFRYSGARARTSPERPDFVREPTSTSECPAIRLRPIGLTTQWQTNQRQEMPFVLEWKVWTKNLDACEIEELAALVIDAIHGGKAAGQVQSCIRDAINQKFPVFTPITFGHEEIGDGPDNAQGVLTATGGLLLPLTYAPVNYSVQ